MKPPLISILIVTWNNENDIEGCIQGFLNSTYTNFNITLVDSASSDRTLEIVKEKFPQVKVIPLQENKYYTGALNVGIEYIQATFAPQYILFLNADTVAEPNMLEELLNAAEDYGMGNGGNLLAVGPKVKYFEEKDKIYSIGIDYDGFMNACQIGIGKIDGVDVKTDVGDGDMGETDLSEADAERFNTSKQVFGVEGTCIFLVAKNLALLGKKPFWEKLKMYSEDVEFFIRAKKHGLVGITAPKAVLYHKVMVSTLQNSSLKIDDLKMKNWLWIALRHYKWKSKIAMLKKYLFRKFSIKDRMEIQK
jgi:hypothetical protein